MVSNDRDLPPRIGRKSAVRTAAKGIRTDCSKIKQVVRRRASSTMLPVGGRRTVPGSNRGAFGRVRIRHNPPDDWPTRPVADQFQRPKSCKAARRVHAVRNELSKLRLVHYMQYPTQSMEAVSPLPWGGGSRKRGVSVGRATASHRRSCRLTVSAARVFVSGDARAFRR